MDYTADQWKMFIMIYATPIMWNLLDEADQQNLTHFVMVCFLLTARIIEDSALDEAHSRLLTVACLVEDNYGSEMITPNIHLSYYVNLGRFLALKSKILLLVSNLSLVG